MKFPYQRKEGKTYPLIPIVLVYKKKKLLTEALLDSGANISLFQDSIAEYLGIKVEEGEKIELLGIGGRIIAYIHQVELAIDGIKFPCKIAFSWELPVSVNILGRDNFFEKFFVCFNEIKKESILEERGNWGRF
ncbi:retropepsin-like domain-containing protein [Patescibacteria group bacterium]|nr:retropepsin-like domain-containing protein [Patescibacteria group bacterium]MBU4481097.1 retropepsin-like domain-containing protein [Patescibacteria group bacterium]